MLIRRCAWHREFHGYALIHGVASWRGLSIKFTDGVCRRCVARVRAEWHVGRTQADSPLRRGWLLPGGYRRAALALGLALLVATMLPTGLITDALLGEVPAQAPATLEVPTASRASFTDTTAVAKQSPEAEPPRVSRHRPAPPEVVVIRYRTPKPLAPARPLPVSSGAPTPNSPHPIETQRLEPPRPVHVATVAPLVTNVSRVRAAEDELMRVARGHSATRLLLSPPEERPRHAGLMVQAP